MKKIVASVGLVALGASGIQNAAAQGLQGPDASKPWSVSATLRGFYDDNVATLPNNFDLPDGTHRDTFGFEISPSANLIWSVPQTTVNLGLLYSYKYYENKPAFSTDHDDQTFTFNAGLTHDFSEQVHARVSDSFVIGQEPDVLRAGNTFSTFQRVSGDNIRNYGSIGLDAQLGPRFGIGLGYDNAFYDYKAHGETLLPDGRIQASLSGALDRIENRAHIEGLYQLQPETKALIGYQFTDFDYTSDELIGGATSPFFPGVVFDPVRASARNSREHTIYVGLEHNFTPQLTGAIRAGASYTDYYNDDSLDASYTPYVNATLRYAYAPQSYVEGGFSYDRNATDVIGLLSDGNFTADAESAVLFLNVSHRVTPKFFANLMGQFQNSSYKGGAYDGECEQYYLAGLDLEYRFNQYFSGHAGYNYDRLESNSSIGRTFDRNRVYIGVTATY